MSRAYQPGDLLEDPQHHFFPEDQKCEFVYLLLSCDREKWAGDRGVWTVAVFQLPDFGAFFRPFNKEDLSFLRFRGNLHDLHGPLAPPAWMSLAEAEDGVRETPGKDDNPRILEYWSACDPNLASEDSSWCSAFANWVMQQAGIEGTRSPVARSWVKWGQGLPCPVLGAITVIRRGTQSWQGHVGFLRAWNETQVQLRGGNQDNAVSLAWFSRRDVLAWRWPPGLKLPTL